MNDGVFLAGPLRTVLESDLQGAGICGPSEEAASVRGWTDLSSAARGLRYVGGPKGLVKLSAYKVRA